MEYEINISTTVIISEESSIDVIEQKVEQQIDNYLLELKKKWEDSESITIRISQIESRILNTEGVIDISNTTLNEGTSNIELEEMQIPILRGVSIS